MAARPDAGVVAQHRHQRAPRPSRRRPAARAVCPGSHTNQPPMGPRSSSWSPASTRSVRYGDTSPSSIRSTVSSSRSPRAPRRSNSCAGPGSRPRRSGARRRADRPCPGQSGTSRRSVVARGGLRDRLERRSATSQCTLSRPSSAARATGRRSCGSRRSPRSPARPRRSVGGRAPTWRSSRSTGGAPAAAPAAVLGRQRPRRRSRRRPTPGRRGHRPAADSWCIRRRRRRRRTRRVVSTSSSSVSTDTPSHRCPNFDHLVTQWISTVIASRGRAGTRPRSTGPPPRRRRRRW